MRARDVLLPQVRARLLSFDQAALIAVLDGTGLPFAPIGRPEDLFEDPHLLAGDGLAPTRLPDGRTTHLPTLPIELGGTRPRSNGRVAAIGEHGAEILREWGLDDAPVQTTIGGDIA